MRIGPSGGAVQSTSAEQLAHGAGKWAQALRRPRRLDPVRRVERRRRAEARPVAIPALIRAHVSGDVFGTENPPKE